MEDAWNEPDGVRLSWAHHRISSIYQQSAEHREIGFARQQLIAEAVALHQQGRYAGAIPVVVAQIDGIVADFTGNARGTAATPPRGVAAPGRRA